MTNKAGCPGDEKQSMQFNSYAEEKTFNGVFFVKEWPKMYDEQS